MAITHVDNVGITANVYPIMRVLLADVYFAQDDGASNNLCKIGTETNDLVGQVEYRAGVEFDLGSLPTGITVTALTLDYIAPIHQTPGMVMSRYNNDSNHNSFPSSDWGSNSYSSIYTSAGNGVSYGTASGQSNGVNTVTLNSTAKRDLEDCKSSGRNLAIGFRSTGLYQTGFRYLPAIIHVSYDVTTPDPAPVISSFSPASGPANTQVTINGTSFISVQSVTLGGTSVQYSVVSDTQISFVVPSGANGGSITVQTATGTAFSSSNFTVDIQQPTISSFSPTLSPIGALITINGSNFINVRSVSFNGVSTSFTVSSTIRISARVPSGATTGRITIVTHPDNADLTVTSTTDFTPDLVTVIPPTPLPDDPDSAIPLNLPDAGTSINKVKTSNSRGGPVTRATPRSGSIITDTQLIVLSKTISGQNWNSVPISSGMSTSIVSTGIGSILAGVYAYKVSWMVFDPENLNVISEIPGPPEDYTTVTISSGPSNVLISSLPVSPTSTQINGRRFYRATLDDVSSSPNKWGYVGDLFDVNSSTFTDSYAISDFTITMPRVSDLGEVVLGYGQTVDFPVAPLWPEPIRKVISPTQTYTVPAGKILAIQNICAPVTGVNYSTTIMSDSPNAYWRCGETTGTLADSTTGGHTLQTTGGTGYQKTGSVLNDLNKAISISSSTGFLYSAYGSTPYYDAVIASGPSAYWKCNEKSGVLITDSIGHITATKALGNLSLAQTDAIVETTNEAIFIGSSGYLTGVHSASMDVNDVFSIEVWLRRNAVNNNATILSRNTNSYKIKFNTSNKLELFKTGISTSIVGSSSAISDTTTYHYVVVTKNGATSKVYIDGADVTTAGTNQTIGNVTSSFNIARDLASGTDVYDGFIDELAVYNNKALSAAEVTNHYNLGTTGSAGVNGLDLANTFTLEAWTKKSGSNTAMTIFAKGASAYLLRLNSSNKIELDAEDGAIAATSTGTITDSKWHHIVATKNGTALGSSKLYLDGADVTSAVGAVTMNDVQSSPLFIGSKSTTPFGNMWDGFLDELAVYPTALSSARVLAHYNAGVATYSDKATLTANDKAIARTTGNGGTPNLLRPILLDSGTKLSVTVDGTGVQNVPFHILGILMPRLVKPIIFQISAETPFVRKSTDPPFYLTHVYNPNTSQKISILRGIASFNAISCKTMLIENGVNPVSRTMKLDGGFSITQDSGYNVTLIGYEENTS